MRRRLPLALAILSLPAGLAGYLATAAVLSAIAPGLATSVLGLFVSLFIAGLCMIPFVAPWFDAKAKEDLARIRAMREKDDAERGSSPPRA
jgi:UPF0716 family protein affecting phage T7 exclusion